MKSVSERVPAFLFTKMGVFTRENGSATSVTAAAMKSSLMAQPITDRTKKENQAARVYTSG